MSNIYGRQVVLPLTNKSGGGLVAGDVVIIDTANDGAVTTTTSAQYQGSVGIAQETIANNATGRVLVAGYAALVNVPSSMTRGRFLETHTVAKQATGNATRRAGSFGQYLTGGTTPTAWLWGFPDNAGAAGETLATSTLWDAAGDIVVATGADAAAKLTAGADNTVLTISPSTHVPVWTAPAGAVVPWNIAPDGGGPMYTNRASGASNRGHRAAVTIPAACTITGVRLSVVTQSGNISVALYNSSDARVATSGAVACPGTGSQAVAFSAGYAAAAGRYWVALSVDNTTAAFTWIQDSNGSAPVLGQYQASAHPLPDPFVSAGPATAPAMVLVVSGGHP